jgi:predicted AAA+ superfamily ATPase
VRRLSDADAYLRAQRGALVILDEVHRVPELFPVLRGIIDARRAEGDRSGGFLLLGSASLDLLQQTSESLTGRVSFVELPPVSLADAAGDDSVVQQLWSRGGFPLALLADRDRDSLRWRRDFIRSYLERDVPMFAPRLPSATIGRLWRMLAHEQGRTLNAAMLARSLEVSSPTVGRYVDLLADLLLIRRLAPWSGNVAKRLVRAPRVFVRDSGLLHALLELPDLDAVLGHPVVGGSWEGFVIETLLAAAGDALTPSFYRTQDGAEMDLVLERGGRVAFAVEVKRSSAPVLSRGYYHACQVLRPERRLVVHGGDASWSDAGVEYVSLSDAVRVFTE